MLLPFFIMGTAMLMLCALAYIIVDLLIPALLYFVLAPFRMSAAIAGLERMQPLDLFATGTIFAGQIAAIWYFTQ